MEVGKKTILNQFIGGNNSTQFVIPIYQRNYVWGKENVEKLLDDIEKMIPFIDNEDKFHFFGSIVYIDTIHKGSFNQWTIIDGQQRLTTIFLILQAMQQIYSENSKSISKKYLINDEDIINSNDELDRYRLKPLVSDDDVYIKIAKNDIENLTQEEKNSNVYKAFDIIKKRLNKWKNDENKKYEFDTILNAIDKFKIVWIQLKKTEEPQQVFESINSTGVNLTPADLIRNFVLMNKDDKTQTEMYDKYWKHIEFDNVGTNNLKEFFRFYISIKEKTTIPEREVYEKFKNEYSELCEEENEEDVLAEILDYSRYYKYIRFDSKDIENENIKNALNDYKNAKTNMPTMVLMEAMKMFFQQIIPENDLVNTIELLTTYIIRRNICGKDTKSISNSFGSLLGKILKYFKEGKLSFYECAVKVFVNDTRLTNQIMPTDEMVREEFEKSNLYSREATAFVLKKIENNENRIPYNKLNIEHVMPQTETNYWKNQINENSEYTEVVNRIGNLTLVDYRDNSSMGNRDFETKKEVLNKSRHIKMNEDILNKNIWNENEIEIRSRKLADEFIKIFKYPKLEIEEDVYKTTNLNEDVIERIYYSTIPVELKIGEESKIDEINTWTDVYREVLKFLFNTDKEQFLKATQKIFENYEYKNNQFSYNESDLRSPIEIDEGFYADANKNTDEKLILLQRMINLMNIDVPISITFISKNEIK